MGASKGLEKDKIETPSDYLTSAMADVVTITIVSAVVLIVAAFLWYVIWPQLRAPFNVEVQSHLGAGAKRLVGREGSLTSDLKAGRFATAMVANEEWTVTANEDLPKGYRVRVARVDGLTLFVEKA